MDGFRVPSWRHWPKIRGRIWGEFSGSLPAQPGGTWVVIGAVDSTFYAIETDDEAVLSTIGAKYRDVRLGEVPVAAWPLRHPQ